MRNEVTARAQLDGTAAAIDSLAGRSGASRPDNRRLDLTFGHPLARPARRRCRSEHGLAHRRVGWIACGACWERVIRDDERGHRFAPSDDAPLPGGRESHFGLGHPLADVARSRCLPLHGLSCRRVGHVACGACWERVIRDDERCAVLYGLPRAIEVDPEYVDEIAVERACAGERQRLTPAERSAAVRLLADRGYTAQRIARRLRLETAQVHALLLAEMSRLAERVAVEVAPAEVEAAA